MFGRALRRGRARLRPGRSTTPAGAAPASASRPRRACARSCTTAAAACPRPRPTRLAALDLRDDVQGSQGYLAVALNALVFTRARAPAPDRPELLALADDFSRPSPPRTCPTASGDLRPRLAAGGARRPGGRAGGTAGLWRARALEWGVGTPQIIVLALGGGRGLPRRSGRLDAGARAGRRGAAAGAGDRRAAAIGVALRAAALAESGERRIDAAARGGRRRWSAREGALELARARVDLGRALVRAGQRGEDARARMRAGQELAFRCGATLLVERAHARAAGHRGASAPHGRGGPRRAHAERAARDRDGRRGA